MRLLLLGTALLVGLALPPRVARAQDFPTKPVTIVVPYTAGGGNDTLARTFGERLSQKWGQPVVVENKPGAGTAIGTRAVIEAPADGYTLLLTSSTALVVAPHTSNLPFDPLTDLEPVVLAVRATPVLAVSNAIEAKTLAEVIDYAKAHPGELNYASAGIGTYNHVAQEYLKKLAGIDMVHIPYEGTSQAVTDMLGGRVHLYLVAAHGVFQELEQAGKLKVVAVATKDRFPLRPDLPTIGEVVPGFSVDVWYGLAAPAGTPPEVMDKIHADVTEVLADPAFMTSFIEPQGYVAGALSREEFKAQVAADYESWGKMVGTIGMEKAP